MKQSIALGGIFAFLAVAIGAFGAHGLKDVLDDEMKKVYETGVQYHMFHALALVAVGLLQTRFQGSRLLVWSARLFTLGIVLFSGSLYALSISGVGNLGAITPLGGVAFLAGWATLVLAVYRPEPRT